MLGDQECATHINVMNKIKTLGFGVLGIAQHDGRRIIDKDIYTAKKAYGLLHGFNDLIFIPYVALHGQCATSAGIDLLRHCVYGAAQPGVFRYTLCHNGNVAPFSSQS